MLTAIEKRELQELFLLLIERKAHWIDNNDQGHYAGLLHKAMSELSRLDKFEKSASAKFKRQRTRGENDRSPTTGSKRVDSTP